MERKYDPADLSSYLNEAEGFQTFSNEYVKENICVVKKGERNEH